MQEQTESLAYELLKIAKTDITASETLYGKRLYAQSFFYFQQATEKATKALALLLEMSDAKGTFDVRHNIFKLHKKSFIDAAEEKSKAIDLAKALPFFETSGLIETAKLKEELGNSNKYLHFLNNMKDYDLINIPAKDIVLFLEKMQALNLKRLRLPKDLELKITDLFMPFIIKMEQDESKAAQYIAEQIRKALGSIEFGDFIKNHFTDLITTTAQIMYAHGVLYFSGLLTIQHSSITRYPVTDNVLKSPLRIYSKKLPVVKHQPAFLIHLRKAIKIIENELQG